MCIICTREIEDENLYTLTDLNVANCLNLTSEKLQEILSQCKNLKELKCSNCRYLTSLDLRKNINLENLHCYCCKSLVSIKIPTSLRFILFFNTLVENVNFSKCIYLESFVSNELMKSIDLSSCVNLELINTIGCRMLTNISLYKTPSIFLSGDCPWITQNKNFTYNLRNLIIIQRWYRRLVLIKYMKSQEFIEWIYNPSNIGGLSYKKKLLKDFNL